MAAKTGLKTKTGLNNEPVRLDRLGIAKALRETGLLINIGGGNPYKARAYLKGATSLENLEDNLDELVQEGKLTEIDGIGEALAAAIVELHRTGKLDYQEKLQSALSPGVLALSEISGMSLKRIRALYAELKIESIEDLERACLEHRVSTVKGFGPKIEASILQNLHSQKNNLQKLLLLDARPIAAQLLAFLKKKTGNKSIEVVGQIRRWLEVVDQIDLVADVDSAAARKKLWLALTEFPAVTEILDATEDFCQVKLTCGITACVHAATDFPAALIAQTGTPEHFVLLQTKAVEVGLTLRPSGLYKGKKKVGADSEKAIYSTLDLAFVPPELRDGTNEIELAHEADAFDDLLSRKDLIGMTHCHTTYSDGIFSIEEMARAAEKLGMQYLTITDHSPQASYAGGLGIDDLKRQWDEIDSVQEKVKIKLLKGTECDILADGRLDYPDHILSRFDLIIASVHQRFRLDHKDMTARVIRAMKDSHFKVWGHPLGRLLLRRDPIDVDVEAILDVLADAKGAIEINGDPHRLDFEPKWIKAARERGIKMIISTDAHSIRDYDSLEYGIHMAMRGGARKSEVLNTYTFKKFCQAVKPGI